MRYDPNAVYTRGRFQIISMTYNCHPETCYHWEHYRYCIQRMKTNPAEWEWFAYDDNLQDAKKIVDALVEGEV